MDCKFQVGDEVVCIEAPKWCVRGASEAEPDLVELDEVYKIISIEVDGPDSPWSGHVFLVLAEKHPDSRYHHSLFRKVEKPKPIEERIFIGKTPEIERKQFRRLKPRETITVRKERVG